MVSESENSEIRPVWFVGASYGRTDDQTSRFLEEGRWEKGYHDRYIDDVKSVLPGDRIAIKATYVKKHNLPFDNRGNSVSVMGIKATGTVTENAGGGRNLKVDWTPVDPPREWLFYTYRGTVWRVFPGRPPALTPEQAEESRRMYSETPSIRRAARIMKVSQGTVKRALKSEEITDTEKE